jgi:hypothetical protein
MPVLDAGWCPDDVSNADRLFLAAPSCTHPVPAVTTRVCPAGWVCHAVRAHAANVTWPAPTLRCGFAPNSGCTSTLPVKTHPDRRRTRASRRVIFRPMVIATLYRQSLGHVARSVVSHAFVGVGVGADPSAHTTVESVDGRNFVRRQVEVEDNDVVHHALRAGRFRDDDDAVLHVPAQDDLGGRPAVSMGDTRDRLIGQRLAVVSERAMRLDCDPVSRGGVAGNVIGEAASE